MKIRRIGRRRFLKRVVMGMFGLLYIVRSSALGKAGGDHRIYYAVIMFFHCGVYSELSKYCFGTVI